MLCPTRQHIVSRSLTHTHILRPTAWPPSSDLNPLALTGPPSRKRRSGLPLGHMKGPWDDTAAANALLTLQETLPVSEQVKVRGGCALYHPPQHIRPNTSAPAIV